MSTKSSNTSHMSTSTSFTARYMTALVRFCGHLWLLIDILCFNCTVSLVPLGCSAAKAIHRSEEMLFGNFHVSVIPLMCCLPEKLLSMQFWELDTDHDFVITKDDLIKYGNHSLTYRIVDRIFQQVLSLHLPVCQYCLKDTSESSTAVSPRGKGGGI